MIKYTDTERSALIYSKYHSISKQKVFIVIIKQPRNLPNFIQSQKVFNVYKEAFESIVLKTKRSKQVIKPSSHLLKSYKSILKNNNLKDCLNLIIIIL